MTASRIGQQIAGKYRLVRLIGEGGMGSVYEAQHTLIGRRFAIKFMHPTLAVSGDILARFRREAQAAGSLESENIAAVTDFGVADDGAPYIVMEYLTGEDLRRVLSREGRMPVPRIVELVIQACRGLHAAHAAGIVHRDLKPENLFIVRRGDGSELVKVLDFGIAKFQTVDGEVVTQTGATMGTPSYMPPEQARGEKTIDHRADVYALGVILYEALSGSKPHPGDSYNAILYHILSKPTLPLESHRHDLPPGLSAVVHRALSFEASDRYPSVKELAATLAPFLGRIQTPSHARLVVDGAASGSAVTLETPPAEHGTSPPEELPARSEPTPMLALPIERGSGRLLAGLTVAVVVVAGGAVLVSKRGEQGPVPAPSVSALPIVTAARAVPVPSVVLRSIDSALPAPALAPPFIASAKSNAASDAPPPRSRPTALGRPSPPEPAPPAVTVPRPSVAAFGAPPAAPAPPTAAHGGPPLKFDKVNPYGP